MKLSKKSEYACLAMIDFAEHADQDWVKITDVCNRKNLPKKFVEQILISLKNAGLVNSKKGSEGGYKLTKHPSEISIAEIIRLMDGALAPVDSVSKYFYQNTPTEQHTKLTGIFKEIRDFVSEKLEKTTLQDLM